MEKVFYDKSGNTLTVWFGNPEDEYISEETGKEVILMLNKDRKVIGFEKFNFLTPAPEKLRISFEAISE